MGLSDLHPCLLLPLSMGALGDVPNAAGLTPSLRIGWNTLSMTCAAPSFLVIIFHTSFGRSPCATVLLFFLCSIALTNVPNALFAGLRSKWFRWFREEDVFHVFVPLFR